MSGDRVAVLLDVKEKTGSEVDKEEKGEQPANPPVYWILGTIYSGSFEFSSSSVYRQVNVASRKQSSGFIICQLMIA